MFYYFTVILLVKIIYQALSVKLLKYFLESFQWKMTLGKRQRLLSILNVVFYCAKKTVCVILLVLFFLRQALKALNPSGRMVRQLRCELIKVS